jgi:flagellar basal-body rod modification protein FlgD
MDIASTLNSVLPGGATGAASATSTAESKATTDYNTFLTLLTAQLKFQDPLAPLDATQFVSQLSQFSSVEQAIVGNQKLDTIIKSLGANSMMADVGLIGHKVELAGDSTELSNGSASLTYSLAKDAAQAGVVVRDASGNIVRSMPVDTSAGEHSLTWDGTSDNGSSLPDGVYSFTFGAADADGKPVTSTSYVTATVTRVESTTDGSQLVLSNGMRTASSAVRAILSA